MGPDDVIFVFLILSFFFFFYNGEKTASLINGITWRKLDSYMQKNQSGLLHKNKFKME